MNIVRICIGVLFLLPASATPALATGGPPADPSWLHFLLIVLVLASGIGLVVALTRALGREKGKGDSPPRRRRF